MYSDNPIIQYIKFLLNFAKPMQLAFKSFFQKTLILLKFNPLHFAKILNSAKIFGMPPNFHIDIQNFMLRFFNFEPSFKLRFQTVVLEIYLDHKF